MHLSYLPVVSIVAMVVLALSGIDCAPTQLGKRRREDGDDSPYYSFNDEELAPKVPKLLSADHPEGRFKKILAS